MNRQRRTIFSDINITPLTDIFLVLLIIMMVIAPMLDSKGLKLAVPTVSPSQQVTTDPKVLTLDIAANGQYSVQNQPVAENALQEKLFQTKGQYPDGLLIQANPDAYHQSVVKALDAARMAGIDKVAVTEASK